MRTECAKCAYDEVIMSSIEILISDYDIAALERAALFAEKHNEIGLSQSIWTIVGTARHAREA